MIEKNGFCIGCKKYGPMKLIRTVSGQRRWKCIQCIDRSKL